MKLLMSVYACAPDRGSEHGIGWNWTIEAHRQGHEVWALVSPSNRDAVLGACRKDDRLSGIRWYFPEVGIWPIVSGREPKFERTYNLLWQRKALGVARKLQSEVGFDAVHHVTWGGVRAPTFLGALGAPLILGPTGGGETSPRRLRPRLRLKGKVAEMLRDVSNATIPINPIVRGGFESAAVIFARTSDTRGIFPERWQAKTIDFLELGIQESQIGVPRPPRERPRKLLYAGRLLYWKGLHIAVEAFQTLLKTIPDAQFTIVGSGSEEAYLKADVSARNLDGRINFISRIPQEELFQLFEDYDLLLFPSLHDSGATVVLEALSHGMPVMCLDLGGPKEVVTSDSGIIVETKGLDTAALAARMAEELSALLQSPARLSALSAGAIARANEFVFSKRVATLYAESSRFMQPRQG